MTATDSIAITGTRHGPTDAQRATLNHWLPILRKRAPWLNHGDCVGVDEEVARAWAYRTCAFPPLVDTHRAFHQSAIIRPAMDYLERNRHMVRLATAVVAVPAEMTPQRRGGTWFTARYAMSEKVPLLLVLPDGSIRRENWTAQ